MRWSGLRSSFGRASSRPCKERCFSRKPCIMPWQPSCLNGWFYTSGVHILGVLTMRALCYYCGSMFWPLISVSRHSHYMGTQEQQLNMQGTGRLGHCGKARQKFVGFVPVPVPSSHIPVLRYPTSWVRSPNPKMMYPKHRGLLRAYMYGRFISCQPAKWFI